MKFLDALHLVVSRRRRIEHTAWVSWAKERLDLVDRLESEAQEKASRSSSAVSSSDPLRQDFDEFMRQHGGKR